jgi:hypothetical protein
MSAGERSNAADLPECRRPVRQGDEIAWPRAPKEEVGHDHQDGSAEAV